jgi:hypothetical protein
MINISGYQKSTKLCAQSSTAVHCKSHHICNSAYTRTSEDAKHRWVLELSHGSIPLSHPRFLDKGNRMLYHTCSLCLKGVTAQMPAESAIFLESHRS